MKQLLNTVFAITMGLVLPPMLTAQTPDLSERYVPPTLAELARAHPRIMVLEVERVDRTRAQISCKKQAELKGTEPAKQVLLQSIVSSQDFDAAALLEWASPGRRAVGFRDDDLAIVCIGNFWFSANVGPGAVWDYRGAHKEYATAYAGPVKRLVEVLPEFLAGREVVLTVQSVDDPASHGIHAAPPLGRDWLYGEKGQILRIRASQWPVRDAQEAAEGAEHVLALGMGGRESIPALIQALRDGAPQARGEAAYDLGELGIEGRAGLTALRAALHDADDRVRIRAAAALLRLGQEQRAAWKTLIAALGASEWEARARAAGVLAVAGPDSLVAARELVVLLRNDPHPVVRSMAALALGRIVPAVAPPDHRPGEIVRALADALQIDVDGSVRVWSVRALEHFGPDVKEVLPCLRQVVLQGKPGSELALEILAGFGPAELPTLIKRLQDAEKRPRQIFARLKAMGPAARDAGRALCIVAANPSESDYQNAVEALLEIDRARVIESLLPMMLEWAGGDDKIRRKWTIQFFGQLGPDAKSAIPVLREALRDKEDKIRSEAAESLGKVGPVAREALPALQVLLLDPSIQVRETAAQALGRIQPGCRVTVSFFAAQLQEHPAGEHGYAIRTLQEMGPAAQAAIPALRKLMQTGSGPDRAEAALAIWKIHQPRQVAGLLVDYRQEALLVLIELIRRGDASTRCSAANALGTLGAAASPAVPALIEALGDRDPRVGDYVAGALGDIGPAAKAALPALEQALRRNNRAVRLSAAQALWQIDHQPDPLVRLLLHGMEITASPWYAWQLGEMGPAARAAVPALMRAQWEYDRDMHTAAGAALKMIDPDAAARSGVR